MRDATKYAKKYSELNREATQAALLVEGVDDWHCIACLMKKLNPSPQTHFQLVYCEGRKNVLAALSAESVASQPLLRLGAIIDTDDSPLTSMLQSVSGAIGNEYSLPETWPENGLITTRPANSTSSGPLKIGLWCMPDNQTQGIFEDLLNRAMPVPARQFVEKAIEEAVEATHAKHREVERPKAVLRTYMAWNTPTCSKYGEALNKDLIPKDALEPHFRPMIDWAQRLFE